MLDCEKYPSLRITCKNQFTCNYISFYMLLRVITCNVTDLTCKYHEVTRKMRITCKDMKTQQVFTCYYMLLHVKVRLRKLFYGKICKKLDLAKKRICKMNKLKT